MPTGDSSHPEHHRLIHIKLCMTSGPFADEDMKYQEFADSCCSGRSRSVIAQGLRSGGCSPGLSGILTRVDAATHENLEHDILGACLCLVEYVISTSLDSKAGKELQLHCSTMNDLDEMRALMRSIYT